jgi:hypothetical protein
VISCTVERKGNSCIVERKGISCIVERKGISCIVERKGISCIVEIPRSAVVEKEVFERQTVTYRRENYTQVDTDNSITDQRNKGPSHRRLNISRENKHKSITETGR